MSAPGRPATTTLSTLSDEAQKYSPFVKESEEKLAKELEGLYPTAYSAKLRSRCRSNLASLISALLVFSAGGDPLHFQAYLMAEEEKDEYIKDPDNHPHFMHLVE